MELSGGLVLPADAVVLALGHLDAHLRPAQKDLVDGAAEHGLTYWPPTVPADAFWSELPSGETVLVRGMGLNFCDALARLTEGRGGSFDTDPNNPERLVYQPSGREPKIVAGSRPVSYTHLDVYKRQARGRCGVAHLVHGQHGHLLDRQADLRLSLIHI